MTEEELIKGCIRENAACQKEVFDRFAGHMLGVCQRYARNSADAEDILQDAFIKVFNKISQFKFEGSFEGWIRRIVVNTALKKYSLIRYDKEFVGYDVNENQQGQADPSIYSHLTEKDLLVMINGLPDGYRLIFNLYVIEGYQHEEIAGMLGIRARNQQEPAGKSENDATKTNFTITKGCSMTNNSPLDEHIKKLFGSYSPDVPSHVWENIIAEKDKRRPAGFWISFLNRNVLFLLLAVVIAGAGVLIYKNAGQTQTGKSNTANVIVNADNKEINSISSNPQAKNINAAENTSITKEQPTNTVNNISGDKNTTINSINRTPGNNKNNILPASTKEKNNDNTNNDMAPYSKNKKPTSTKGTSSVAISNPGIASSDDDNTGTSSNEFMMARYLLSLDMLRSQKDFTAAIRRTKNPHLDIPCPEAEKNTAGNKRYFEIYAGPDYAFRSITDTGHSAYLQKRKESTSFSSAFSAGLRYTKVFGNGMSFRTGINYSQINEKFKYVEGNIVQLIYIINTNGDTTGSYTATGTRYKTTHNKFRTIDIPLLIGYELGNGRWHVNFNAGAIVNAYSWQKGDVLDTAYKPVSITTGKGASSPYQFKTNVGIGFMGAVSVYYKLTDRLHILAEPYFRYSFTAASKSELTLKQKYNTAGLRLGIRWDF